jgi:hypothetical protein
MVTLELLEDFTVDELHYKPNFKPIGFKIYSKFIHIMFDETGETIEISKYTKWYRDKKINIILND